MGYGARASSWKKQQPWQGLAHPHAGKYGLLGLIVDGVPEGVSCTILLGVGQQGVQQQAAELVVVSSGEAQFLKPVNLRDGVPLWFKASLPGVNVASRTADIVPTPADRAAVAVAAATAAVLGRTIMAGTGSRALVNMAPGRGRIAQALERRGTLTLARPRTKIDDPEAL